MPLERRRAHRTCPRALMSEGRTSRPESGFAFTSAKPDDDRLANSGSAVRRRAGGLERPAADTSAGVSRLWESWAARTNPATHMWVGAIERFSYTDIIYSGDISRSSLVSTGAQIQILSAELQGRGSPIGAARDATSRAIGESIPAVLF